MFHLFRFMPQIAQTSLSNIACQVLQLSRYQWKLPLSPAQHLCQQGIHVLANSRFFMCFLPQHVIQGPNEHWHADQHHWHADQHLSNGAYGCCYLRRSGLLRRRCAPHVYITQATRSEQVHRQIKTYLTPPALNFFFGRCVWCNVLPDWIWRVWKKLAIEFQALSAGAPQVVYSSSPYMMPAETIGTMPMTSYTTEMPLAYSSWPQKRQKVNWCEAFWRLFCQWFSLCVCWMTAMCKL